MNDNDEIAVTIWRALEKADTPEAGGIVLAKLVATWLGGYRPLDRAARWSEFQHTMRQEIAARDRRFFGERVVQAWLTLLREAVPTGIMQGCESVSPPPVACSAARKPTHLGGV